VVGVVYGGFRSPNHKRRADVPLSIHGVAVDLYGWKRSGSATGVQLDGTVAPDVKVYVIVDAPRDHSTAVRFHSARRVLGNLKMHTLIVLLRSTDGVGTRALWSAVLATKPAPGDVIVGLRDGVLARVGYHPRLNARSAAIWIRIPPVTPEWEVKECGLDIRSNANPRLARLETRWRVAVTVRINAAKRIVAHIAVQVQTLRIGQIGIGNRLRDR